MRILAEIITKFIDFINNTLVPLVFAIAFIIFLFGVYRYFILGGANDEKRKEGRDYIFWSVIAFAVMISVWGLVNLIVNTFGFNSLSRPALPTFGEQKTAPKKSTTDTATGKPESLIPPGFAEPTPSPKPTPVPQ